MESNTHKTLEDLKTYILTNLSTLIDSDFVLLDVPNHINIGDQLIYRGELDFFKTLDYLCKFKSSLSYDTKFVTPAKIILLHGGGNFGDLYPLHQHYREKIVEMNLDKKIIILPQSVHFKNLANLKRSIQVFNKHPNLCICVRDIYSFNILKDNNFVNRIMLVPDMAFCSKYSKSIKPIKDLLILKRLDIEKSDFDFKIENSDYDISDWPTFEKSNKEFFFRVINRINVLISKLISFKGIYGVFPIRDENAYSRIGIDFLSKYRFIISNRLHGHILALLLSIPSILVDNSYGKNKRFYDTWLKDIKHSYFANNFEEAMVLYKKLPL